MPVKTDDHIGEIFGDWKILCRYDSKKLLCQCNTCGLQKAINKYSILNGDSLKCKHNKDDSNIIGKTFGEWFVLGKSSEYGKMNCKCSCGNIKAVSKARLIEGRTLSCGHNKFIDLSGKTYGTIKVIEYNKFNHSYLCECTECKSTKYFKKHELENGNFDVCKCKKVYDLTDKTFGNWHVIKKIDNKFLWLCECSCGTIKSVSTQALVSGTSKSCGHDSTGFRDLTGQKFGYLVAEKYLGNSRWLCKCICGNSIDKHRYDLLNNADISCGCKIDKHKGLKTKLEKYGETCMTKKGSERELWQIQALESRESLLSVITNKFKDKPTLNQLSSVLGITKSSICNYIHKYELEEFINILDNESDKEMELRKLIENVYKGKVVIHDRTVLQGLELDIYIPDKKLAIEFNGNYWHSSTHKDKYYHQQKTIACAKQGIQLIHIFEYEWDNQKDSVKKLLTHRLSNANNIIYARNLIIREIDTNKCNKFLENNHLQGSCNYTVSIGAFLDNELISVITLGKPRFNNKYQYELIRYCVKDDYKIIGGAEKIFSYFVKQYNPTSIITYTDISKFTGNVYTRLGFHPIQPNPITEPNYVWVSHTGNMILSRYQTQKHKLVEQGLGTEEQTEDEIMVSLDYLKIHDSGNLKLEWRKENDS